MSWIDQALQRYALAPEHPAKLRIFGWMYRLLRGSRPLDVTVAAGLRLRIGWRDHVDQSLLFTGWHEKLTTEFLRANTRPGDTALVAGAHIGYHALLLARHVGAAGRVVACEPQPATLARAWEHARLNHADNLTLVGHALGAEAGYVTMTEPPAENTGGAALSATAESPYRAYVERIDVLLPRLGVSQLDVLLLDVEGFERQALEGLGTFRPRLLVLESDPRHHELAGDAQDAFFAFVRNLGYDLYSVTGQPVTAGWYPEANVFGVRQGDPAPAWVKGTP